ncbi:hypothetical protein ABVK25_008829 [Lepraria finkii]|uniref:Cation-transporting P-type ATPase N-terminal domain-containing protein n=1 Tax=Lepraria finkii TaxID=1340010 RepID=A0ABR4B1P2_9LECA
MSPVRHSSITDMAGNQNGGPSTMTPVQHTAPVEDKISLDLKEAFINVQPSTSGDGLEDTNEVEHFNKLLADLEAEDKGEKPVVEDTEIGTSIPIPDEVLQTDVFEGLNDTEVKDRCSIYGPNQLKEHEHSYTKRFASFFVGPIQFVMIINLKQT